MFFYTAALSFLVPEMTAEQEFFLYELETTDPSSIGLVLRLFILLLPQIDS